MSNAIRSKVRGDVATRYREDDKQIEILVRADERQRNTIDSIQNLLDQCSECEYCSAIRHPAASR